jgi:hypothetical protein
MATKTFKLGEICKGGVITVEIQGKTITVIGKDWDTSSGFSKGSNQTNAKEFDRVSVKSTDSGATRSLDNFISDLTTSYWTDQIIKWIESKIEFKSKYDW